MEELRVLINLQSHQRALALTFVSINMFSQTSCLGLKQKSAQFSPAVSKVLLRIFNVCISQLFIFHQEGSENEEEEREEEEEENTDYLTDSNKENETDEENNVRYL